MKGKELLYLLGFRPAARTYGHKIASYPVDGGTVEYANWLHPKQNPYRFSQAEVDFLRSFIRPGDCAIDIGARLGDTALPMALACGPNGTVLAFEPNRYVFKVLEVNSGLNGGRVNIVPLNYAVTEEDGDFVFNYSDPGYSNGGFQEGISVFRHGHTFPLDVKGVALEPLLKNKHPEVLEKLRYLKVDTEGYDLSVMKSIRGLLAAKRPYIRTEVYKWLSADRRRETFQFLTELGYGVHTLDDKWQLNPLSSEAEMHQSYNFDIFAVPR